MKSEKQTNKLKNKKTTGAKSINDISDRDKLIIDNYLETYNKSQSVLSAMPELKHQSQGNHIFESIWLKTEVKKYVKERRSYLSSQRPGLTLYEVANELQNQAFADVTSVLKCKTDEDIEALPASTKRLIQNYKIRERTETDRAGREVTTKEYDFKFVDKLNALKEYNKVTGMYLIDNQQKNNSFDISKLPIKIQLTLLKALEEQEQNQIINI